MPTIQAHAPSERALQIIALAKEALSGADEVRARIRRSTEAALECGRLLLKERTHVQKTLGHGTWLSYYEATFAKVMPERTAHHWMRQAKSAIATLRSRSESNQLRNDVLTLGLFPPKQHADAGGTYPQKESLPKNSTHLGIINRFSAWHAWLMTETKGEIGYDQARQLMKDFEPIECFIASLRTTIEWNASKDL